MQESRGQSPGMRLSRFTRVWAYPFYRHGEYLVLARPLAHLVEPAGLAVNFTIREIQKPDLPAVQAIASASDGERFAGFLAHGGVGLAAELDGRVMGYGWASPSLVRNLHRISIPLLADDAFVHDIFICPEFRGQGVATALVMRLLYRLREQGYHRAVNHVSIDNEAARSVHRRWGYVEQGRVIHRRVFWWDNYAYIPSDHGGPC